MGCWGARPGYWGCCRWPLATGLQGLLLLDDLGRWPGLRVAIWAWNTGLAQVCLGKLGGRTPQQGALGWEDQHHGRVHVRVAGERKQSGQKNKLNHIPPSDDPSERIPEGFLIWRRVLLPGDQMGPRYVTPTENGGIDDVAENAVDDEDTEEPEILAADTMDNDSGAAAQRLP